MEDAPSSEASQKKISSLILKKEEPKIELDFPNDFSD